MVDYLRLSRDEKGRIILFDQAPTFKRDRYDMISGDVLTQSSATLAQPLRGSVATVDCGEHGRESGLR